MAAEADGRRRQCIITIGPQCAGKTTQLARMQAEREREGRPPLVIVAVDDFAGLYRTKPWADCAPDSQHALVRSLVMRPMATEIDSAARAALASAIAERERTAQLVDSCLAAIDSVRAKRPSLACDHAAHAAECAGFSAHVNLVDFRQLDAAVADAQARLEAAMARGDDVAYGNTGATYDALAPAVRLALRYDYEVVVAPHGLELSLDVLFARNIARALKTGVFVPAEVIRRTRDRIAQLEAVGYTDCDTLVAQVRGEMARAKHKRG